MRPVDGERFGVEAPDLEGQPLLDALEVPVGNLPLAIDPVPGGARSIRNPPRSFMRGVP
jgi:hypothetical protein